MKIDIKYFMKQCYLKMFLPILITLLFGLLLNLFICIDSWINLGIKVLLVATIYAVCIMIFGLNKDEKKFLINLMNIKRKKL